jgi:hypothetical protein
MLSSPHAAQTSMQTCPSSIAAGAPARQGMVALRQPQRGPLQARRRQQRPATAAALDLETLTCRPAVCAACPTPCMCVRTPVIHRRAGLTACSPASAHAAQQVVRKHPQTRHLQTRLDPQAVGWRRRAHGRGALVRCRPARATPPPRAHRRRRARARRAAQLPRWPGSRARSSRSAP